MTNQGAEAGSNQGQWHMGWGVICLGEPTDLSGLLYSCFQHTREHSTYFKTKQSSLKTVHHSHKFTFINMVSWSLSVPVNVLTVPVGTYREMHS